MIIRGIIAVGVSAYNGRAFLSEGKDVLEKDTRNRCCCFLGEICGEESGFPLWF